MKYFVYIFLITASLSVKAQFTYELSQEIEVEVNGKFISLPWAGGLNSVQVNTMDINGDNKEDLVLFDRTANKLLTYVNDQNKYKYTPEYEEFFPSEITQWLLLRDLNCDGRKDIFTSDPFGMVAFINTTKTGKDLTWRAYNPGFPILTKGFTSNVNLKVNESDIPAIDDIDGDGDLDILNVRFVGIGSVEYHKNLSIERTGTCDSLQLERVTQEFGDFEECDCGQFAFGETCAELNGGRTQHAGGKALLTFDMDNDGDKEILFSEEECPRVFLLENIGNAQTALMNDAERFPTTNSVAFINFPAPFLEDLDFDGLKDIVASPNLYARVFQNVNFNNSMWWYKNTGTNSSPVFTFQKTNFLQDEMIDVGDYAVPAFVDADNDNDLDLFISNYANTDFSGAITFYENIGSATNPKFKFVTSDYVNFSFANFYNVKLQFSDIDNNGTPDLVFTGTGRQNGITSLNYVPNRSSNSLDFSGKSLEGTSFTISQTENVLITDINQDGLTDLLIGKNNGAIHYYRNSGPASAFNYILEDESFLNLGASIDRQSPSLAIDDLDADGHADLVLMDQRGILSIYNNFRAQDSNIEPIKEIIYNSKNENYYSKNLGGRGWPVVANLFNTDKPLIVVGNTLGGIHILKNNSSKKLPETPVVNLYPNPVPRETEMIVKIKPDRNGLVQFYTILGQKMSESHSIPANQEYPFIVSGWPAGIYIVRFSANGKIVGKKFIVP